jgi:hypothetical protein
MDTLLDVAFALSGHFRRPWRLLIVAAVVICPGLLAWKVEHDAKPWSDALVKAIEEQRDRLLDREPASSPPPTASTTP